MAKERIERDEEDLVRLYLTDIGQYPLLTKDDEVRLAQLIEKGNAAREQLNTAKGLTPAKKRELRRGARHGDDAQQTFVQSNLRLVVSIAKKYQASGLPLLDLIQEGNLGLMHAVEKFDWRKGFKFSTYATWWIRQAITRGIANTGRTIRLPVHAGDTLARLQKARSRLELKLGRPATLAELAGKYSEAALDDELKPYEAALKGVFSGGGKIVAGTDSPIIPYGLGLHVELESYVHAGLTPFQALQTATVNAANALGLGDELGTIEPGKRADLAFVTGDPLTDIRATRDVKRVMKGGRIFTVNDLLSRH